MSAASIQLPTPKGPGSGAPHLPGGFTCAFASHCIDTGEPLLRAVIGGAGHWVAEQAPEEMVAALAEFLAPYREGRDGKGGGSR